MKRILFMAEAVTLAHVVRPVVLSQLLDGDQYDVVLAADDRFDSLFKALPAREKLSSISSTTFLKALEKGKPLYDRAMLMRYVEEDLALFERVNPDVVVGDFRLSLSVSARIRKVPYATITNAYWSPFAQQRYPVPDLPMNRALGVSVSQLLFDLVRPAVFALHTVPLTQVRRHFGLPFLGSDLRRTYTDADVTLYADAPGLIRTKPMPPNHQYIGPVLWSPDVPLPDWWQRLETGKPLVYITLGSSGAADKLGEILKVLSALDVVVIIATAGRASVSEDYSTAVHSAKFLPGTAAAERADLVICNGGSPTTQQALAAGTPVIGVCSNLDQYLNMSSIEQSGCGSLFRSDRIEPGRLAETVAQMLADRDLNERVQAVGRSLRHYRPDELFPRILGDLADRSGLQPGMSPPA